MMILSWASKLNVYFDQITTRTLNKITKTSTIVPFLPTSIISLTIQDISITHHVPSQIQQKYSKIAQEKLLNKQYRWKQGMFDELNWDQFRSIFNSYSVLQRSFISKWIYHLLPLHKRQQIYIT